MIFEQAFALAYFGLLAVGTLFVGVALWREWRHSKEFLRQQADFRRRESEWMFNLIRRAKDENCHEAK